MFLDIFLLLALAGDIETNPGSNTDQYEFCNLLICHIKPKLNDIYKIEMIRHDTASNYNIITLSKTWLNDSDDVDDFAMHGFQRPFVCKRVSLGGGVLCWVAYNIAVQRSDLGINEIEVMWLEIRENVKFLMCVTCRPPSCDDFWIYLQSCLDNVYITGDGNQKYSVNWRLRRPVVEQLAVVNNLSTLIYRPT